MKRPARLLLMLAMLPALVPLAMVLKFGVNAPYWDEWDPDLGGLSIKLHQHQLTFGDLVQQHNEHRMFIPRVVLLPLNALTGFNAVGEMLLAWVILCFTSFGILQLLRQTHSDPQEMSVSPRVVGLWFLCNLMIFTPMQTENLLWGVGVINFLPMAFTVWALVTVMSQLNPLARTIIGILLAAGATYSSGNGILAWPMAIGLIVFLEPRGSSKRRELAAWALAAIAFIGLYFIHYHRPEQAGESTYAHGLSQALVYLATFLGAGFAFSGPFSPFTMAPVAGAIMLLAFIAIAEYARRVSRRGDRAALIRLLAWLAIGGFAIVSGMLGALTRAGLGVGQAIQSTRYISYSLYLPLSLLVLVPAACEQVIRRASGKAHPVALCLPAIVASIIVLLQLFCFPEAMRLSQTEFRLHHEAKGTALLINVLPENPTIRQLVYPKLDVAIRQVNAFNDLHWLRPPLITTNNALQIASTNSQEIQSVKGRLERGGNRGDGQLTFIGWAVFLDKSRPADLVFLTYDNPQQVPIIFAAAQMGIVRDDVSQQLDDSNFEFSGWVATVPATSIPSEMKQPIVRAWALDTDTGKSFLLAGEVQLK